MSVNVHITINPADENELARYPLLAPAQLESLLANAKREASGWRTTTPGRRAACLQELAARLRVEATSLSVLISLEMGKPITESRAEIEKCASACEYYAEHGPAMLENRPIASDAKESFVAFRPLGIILAIMPWNFPFWQVFRFALPAFMAGNVCMLKHAANVSGCALAIERLALAAGFPTGTFTTLLIENEQVEQLIRDDRIAAVTLTGSERAGISVASIAGSALKKCVLELGGSDPFIVCADADIEQAAEIGVKSRFQNAGQSCIAAKRFLIDARVYDTFLHHFTHAAQRLIVGDPQEEHTQLGPLARRDLRDTVDRQVRQALEDGASIVTGGAAIDRTGYYYAPTVITGAAPSSAFSQQEVFGPVANMLRVKDIEEAIEVANHSPFGLGSSVWTSDPERGKRIAARIEAGSVFINGLMRSDARLPFGGVKHSGYGRELGDYGMHEFMNLQTVHIT